MLPYVDQIFEVPAKLTGASTDELKLIGSFLLSYPLAALLKRIPDGQPWKKNVFIIAVSLFYIIGLFDLWDGLRTLLYSAAATYAIAYYVDGSLMPWIGFLFLMGHMSINHIDRQRANDNSAVDITGAQMVMVMKLSSFCWNIHDGRLPKDQLSDPQKYSAITKFPGILDYLGYVFFFPSLFAGPSFEFVVYRRWIDTTLFEVPPGTDPSKVPPTRKKRKIPRSGGPAAMKAAAGLVWILAFIQLGSYFTTHFVLSDEFLQYSLLRRIFNVHMLGFTARTKYYGVWALTEGACILSGMGYNGFDPKSGNVFWNRLQNVDPWAMETAQNSHAYLGNWNKNTNHWLRNYIYLRVTPKGKKPGFRASMATFATSALWHGFHPGYYMTFVLGSFIQTVAKNFRRYVRPFFLTPDGTKPTPNKRYYDILSWLATQLTLSFAVIPFIILNFEKSVTAWSRVYFYGIVNCAISLVAFASFSPLRKYLVAQLKSRNRAHFARTEPMRPPVLGLPNDPERDFDEAVAEIMAEIESRGLTVKMPTVEELKAAVEELKTTVEQRIGRMPTGEELKAAIEQQIGRKL